MRKQAPSAVTGKVKAFGIFFLYKKAHVRSVALCLFSFILLCDRKLLFTIRNDSMNGNRC